MGYQGLRVHVSLISGFRGPWTNYVKVYRSMNQLCQGLEVHGKLCQGLEVHGPIMSRVIGPWTNYVKV